MPEPPDDSMTGETVGCVCVDAHGELAAGTSTGGRTNKPWGRIGDSGIIGAGTLAEGSVALSGTGIGEAFIRGGAARSVCFSLSRGSRSTPCLCCTTPSPSRCCTLGVLFYVCVCAICLLSPPHMQMGAPHLATMTRMTVLCLTPTRRHIRALVRILTQVGGGP
jgi:hypothetical protein